MNPKRKETRRIFQELFKPSCYCNTGNTTNLLECARKHILDGGLHDCRWYTTCMNFNLDRWKQAAKEALALRPDLEKKYRRIRKCHVRNQT